METPLQLYLLRKEPEVRVNGVVYTLPPQPMKLLTVMGDKGEPTYFRDELVKLLYGTANQHLAFSKKALYPLRSTLPIEFRSSTQQRLHLLETRISLGGQLIFC
ncbi:MAG: hypothetical protein IPK17_17995 [Chloroflexi bacterium]|uniref:hypothetical protein n=1 Tax=Candidatus Flexifilum breve TaxID=3140694 RepID=UPI0031347BCB|nr:hypothetical protein [Chloroflexota bacterium]